MFQIREKGALDERLQSRDPKNINVSSTGKQELRKGCGVEAKNFDKTRNSSETFVVRMQGRGHLGIY